MKLQFVVSGIALALLGVGSLDAQTPAPAPSPSPVASTPRPVRPPLFFREEWQQSAKGGEHPVTAESVGNSDLELQLHVPAGEILLTGVAGDENNPIHLWSGMCTTPCAASFRSRSRLADLSGLARIRWNTKMSGYHQIRPIVKLADGTWLVGDQPTGSTRDWLFSELLFADVRWMKLDIARVVATGTLLDKVDLTRVEAIGFADLMPGSGHGPGGWSDVAQVEVYGKSAPRGGSAPTASGAQYSGNWKLDNTFNGRVSAIHCTLVQSGDALSGSCKPDVPGMAASQLAGTVKGSTAKWGYDLEFNGKPARVDYEVTLAADGSLSGNLLRNGSASPITGVRQP